MIIYMATNKKNGKRYIGLTSRTLEKRIKEHKIHAKNNSKQIIHKAIRKHGFDAFEWEVIDNAMFNEDLKEKEKYWVKHYDTYKNGYNSTLGGDGALGLIVPKGEDNHSSKYTNAQVKEVLRLLFEGKLSYTEISKITNVSFDAINSINIGKNWKHLYKGKSPKEAGRTQIIHYTRGNKHGNCVINEEKVIEVKRLLAEDLSLNEVVEITGVTKSTVKNIKSGRAWNWLKTDFDKKMINRPFNRKFTDEQIFQIKYLLSKGKSQSEIAREFKVNVTNINSIANGRLYGWLKTPYDEKIPKYKSKRKLNVEEIKQIRKLLEEGNLTQKKIGEMFDVDSRTIGRIKNGQRYKNIAN